MKSIIRKIEFPLIVSFLLLFVSCDDMLTPNKDGALLESDIWVNTTRSLNVMYNIYNTTPTGYHRIDGAMLAAATDEAVHSVATSNIKALNDGTWGPSYLIDDVWDRYFDGIRKVNEFLYNIDSVEIKPVVGTIDQIQLTRTRSRLKREALFLRALFYHELTKRYAGVPLITSYYRTIDYTKVARASYNDCVQQMVADCDSAAVGLPESYKGTLAGFDDIKDLGRPTKWAAKALKARILLYKASPLNRGNDDPTPYYKAVGDICSSIMTISRSKPHQLIAFGTTENINNIFTPSTLIPMYNKEIIFSTSYFTGVDIERNNVPARFGGSGQTNPTQNLAEAFFDLAKEMNVFFPTDPYSNLDPRFYEYFNYNGKSLTVNNKTYVIDTKVGGLDALGSSQTATRTGYYLNKFIMKTSIWDGSSNVVNRTFPVIRYAELLLNFAEARNEQYTNPDNCPGDSIRKAIQEVHNRSRGGVVGTYIVPAGISQSQMRDIIRRERQIELAFEEHRFFDVRRWRLYDDPIQREKLLTIKGVKITKDEYDVTTYEPYIIEKRVWNNRMYNYPIPRAEIIRCPLIKQNPGWE